MHSISFGRSICHREIVRVSTVNAWRLIHGAKIIDEFFHHGKKSFFEQIKQVKKTFRKMNTTLVESFCNRYIYPYYEIIHTNKEIQMCMNETNRVVS